MSAVVVCPACGAKVRVQAAGKAVRCPRCKEALQVPTSAVAQQPRAPSAAGVPLLKAPELKDLPKPGFPWLPVVLIAAPVALLLVGGGAFVIGVLLSRNAAPATPPVAGALAQPSVPPATSPTADRPAPTPPDSPPPPAPPKEQTDFAAWPGAFRYMTVGLAPSVEQVALHDDIEDLSYTSPDAYLLVAIRINDTSPVRTIHYDGWSGGLNAATVHDEFGNTYRQIAFGLGVRPVKQITQASILPGRYVDDLLVFEPPLRQAKRLTLTLPLEQVDVDRGDADRLTFTIAASTLRR